MTRRVLRAATPGTIAATLALLAVLLFRLFSSEVALDAYVLVLGAIALFALVTTATDAEDGPSRSVYHQALEPRALEAERPRELGRLEREVALGVDTAFYAHYRLRPLLREIAEHRLEGRYATALADPRAEARASLPEDAWQLFDPDRRPPRDPHGPGLGKAGVRAIVDALERIEA